MSQTEQTIEAEVVEIDGVSVQPRPAATSRPQADWKQWGNWQGRIKTLDSRWWPLWVVLGFIALVLVVSVAMCAAVLWIAYKLTLALFVGALSLFFPNGTRSVSERREQRF